MKLVTWLSYPLGRLTWHLSKTKRSSTQRNLQACYPDMNESERDVLARQSMRHYVLSILETGLCWHGSAARIHSLFDETIGLEELCRAEAEGCGVLLLVPHCGCWELINHWFQHYFHLVSLYKPGSDPAFNAKFLAKRRRLGAGMEPANRSGLRNVYKWLIDGNITAVLPDQEPSLGQGRFVPFFGVPALTGVLAHRMLRKTGCKVFYAMGIRMSGSRYQTHFIAAGDEVYSEDMDESMAAINRGVEDCIALERAQYLWAYKRFSKRPEGEPRFYKRRSEIK